MHDEADEVPEPHDQNGPDASSTDPTGITLAEPITDDELAELDFLRYESAHLQSRVRDLERRVKDVERDRDTIQHERNLMAQDFQWTLTRLAESPLAPVLRRMKGFRTLNEKWGTGGR